MKAFLTGSMAYGTPHNNSDIDLVVLTDETTADVLHKHGDCRGPYDAGGSFSVRFGKLNVIVCLDEKDYNVWMEGTRELESRKPVTREEAVKVLKEIMAFA